MPEDESRAGMDPPLMNLEKIGGAEPPFLTGEPPASPSPKPGESDSLELPTPAGRPILHGHLHPTTLVFALIKSFGFLIPAIPLLLFGRERIFAIGLLLGGLLVILRALARYYTFSYRIDRGDLIIRQGILERTERHIPLERVQEIRVEQGVLHRFFGVVDARIETAGGEGPEATLSVLSRTETERLRQAVLGMAPLAAGGVAGRAAPETTAAGPILMRRITLRELALAGLTSNHLVSIMVLLGGVWTFLDDYLPKSFYQPLELLVSDAQARLWEQPLKIILTVMVVFGLLSLLAGLVLSVIGTILLFYGFTLSLNGEDLHRSFGLLTHRSSSLSRRRIQVLEIKEGVFRRLFRLAMLRADSAADRASDSEENRKGRDVLLPVMPRQAVDGLLPVIFPDLEQGPIRWNRVSPLSIWRGTVKGGLLCLAAAAGLCTQRHDWLGLGPLVLLPLVYAANRQTYKHLGYVLGERYLRTCRGWLSRSTHIVPIRNAQTIVVEQSLFDRWLGLATLIVDTAGQTHTGGGPRISHLPLADASLLAQILSRRAAATPYRW